MKHIKMHKIEKEVLRYLLSGTVLLMYGCCSMISTYFKMGTESLRLIMITIMLLAVTVRVAFTILESKNIIEIEDMDLEEDVRYYYTQGLMLNQSELIIAWALLASAMVLLIKTNELVCEIKFVEGLAFLVGIIDINKGIILSNEMKNEDFYE